MRTSGVTAEAAMNVVCLSNRSTIHAVNRAWKSEEKRIAVKNHVEQSREKKNVAGKNLQACRLRWHMYHGSRGVKSMMYARDFQKAQFSENWINGS